MTNRLSLIINFFVVLCAAIIAGCTIKGARQPTMCQESSMFMAGVEITAVRFTFDGKLRLRLQSVTPRGRQHTMSYYPEIGDQDFLQYLAAALGPEELATTNAVVRFESEITFMEMIDLVEYLAEMGFGIITIERSVIYEGSNS